MVPYAQYGLPAVRGDSESFFHSPELADGYMKTITGNEAIRLAIRQLLDDSADERVIAVAFVGRDATDFIRDPAGARIYCWPQPGGTNPDGVDKLIKKRAKVHFVERLHSKIYWSKKNGTIIGSANLTKNALGEGGLQEAVVWLPPGHFDMKGYIDELSVLNDAEFERRRRQLHVEHALYQSCNPRPRASTEEENQSLEDFGSWFRDGKVKDWQFGWFEEDEEAPSDASEGNVALGGRSSDHWLSTKRSKDLRNGVHALCFKIADSGGGLQLTQFHWWMPVRGPVPTSDKEYFPYRFFWFGPRTPSTSPPFDIKDKVFQRALVETINAMRGKRKPLPWIRQMPLSPSKRFLQKLDHFYSS